MEERSLGVDLGVPKSVVLKPIPGVSNKYAAGSDGRIYCYSNSRRAARLPKPFRLADGPIGADYPTVTLIIDGRRIPKTVHSMVCAAFHGPKPSPTHEVRHLNGDRLDSRPTELAWGTQAQNEADKRRHGRVAEGSRHGIAKLNEEAVRILRVAIPRGLWNPVDASVVFGVHPSVIRAAVAGKSWKHVN